MLREILEELKNVILNDDTIPSGENASFVGIKRMIYGLWHKGCNEKNRNMVIHFGDYAQMLYLDMIEKYENTPEIKVNIND